MQEDEKFLSEVFAQLTDEATDDDKRCELVSQRSGWFFECFKLQRLHTNSDRNCAAASAVTEAFL